MVRGGDWGGVKEDLRNILLSCSAQEAEQGHICCGFSYANNSTRRANQTKFKFQPLTKYMQ